MSKIISNKFECDKGLTNKLKLTELDEAALTEIVGGAHAGRIKKTTDPLVCQIDGGGGGGGGGKLDKTMTTKKQCLASPV